MGKVQRPYLFLLKQKKIIFIFNALHLIQSYLNVSSNVHVITCAYNRRELNTNHVTNTTGNPLSKYNPEHCLLTFLGDGILAEFVQTSWKINNSNSRFHNLNILL